MLKPKHGFIANLLSSSPSPCLNVDVHEKDESNIENRCLLIFVVLKFVGFKIVNLTILNLLKGSYVFCYSFKQISEHKTVYRDRGE